MSQPKLAIPNMTNVPRQVANINRPIINGGVKALPIRANEWTIPCAKPHFSFGVQLAIARVAVGKVAPSPNPNASLQKNKEVRPPTAPVKTVEPTTMAQQTASVRLGPNLSPIQPPKS